MQSILINEFFPNLLLNTGSMTLPIRMTPLQEPFLSKKVCVRVHASSWIHGVESYVLERIFGVSSARL